MEKNEEVPTLKRLTKRYDNWIAEFIDCPHNRPTDTLLVAADGAGGKIKFKGKMDQVKAPERQIKRD